MLAYYFYTTLVFVSWNVARWILDGQRRFASFESGHSVKPACRTSMPAPRLRIVSSGAWASRQFDAIDNQRRETRIQRLEAGGAPPYVEASVPPKSGAPANMHKDHDKIFRVVEGTFRFRCAGDMFNAVPGTTVIVARGVEHSWVNLEPTPGRITFSFVPGGSDGLCGRNER